MISYKENNQKFNFRVGAIILSDDKKRVLLHTIKGYGFYLLPGGRVEMMESSIDAIKRELFEELALQDISPKIRLSMEDFFEFNGTEYHEISNNFVVELSKDHKFLEENDEFCGVEGEKYIFKWVDINDLDKYVIKPEKLKLVIQNYLSSPEYFVLEEREK